MVVSVVALLGLTYAGAASACNDPTIALNGTTQAGPGQVVPFSFANTAAGATYTVSVNGEVMASGTASGPSVSGSFVMPNLGSSSTPVDVGGRVVHDDTAPYDWPSSASLTYVPPVSPAPTAPPASASPPPPNTSPASRSQPTATRGAAPQTSAPAASSGTPVAGHAGAGTAAHTSVPVAASQAVPGTGTAHVFSAPVSTARVIAGRHQRQARAIARARATSLALGLPVGRVARSLVPASSRTNAGDETLLIVVGSALLVLIALGGGGALAAGILRRRRPQAPPMVAAVDESEVQPMSEADLLLRGVDLDAEFGALLCEPTSEGDRSADPVPR